MRNIRVIDLYRIDIEHCCLDLYCSFSAIDLGSFAESDEGNRYVFRLSEYTLFYVIIYTIAYLPKRCAACPFHYQQPDIYEFSMQIVNYDYYMSTVACLYLTYLIILIHLYNVSKFHQYIQYSIFTMHFIMITDNKFI